MHSTNETTGRPWNLGRFIGPKLPFKPKHNWAIRTRLQHEGRTRDLALFNTTTTDASRNAPTASPCDTLKPQVLGASFESPGPARQARRSRRA